MSKHPLKLNKRIMGALGGTAMLGPIATDAYLPAIPAMAVTFAVPGSTVQFALATFIIGQGIGQFVFGSLSDRLGRKPVLVLTTLLLTAAALVASVSPNVSTLIALCAFMGFSVAGGISSARAVIADLTPPDEAAKPFALLVMLHGIGPIIGPIIGTIILLFSTWRGIFVCLALLGAVATLALALLVPESLEEHRRHTGGFTQMLHTAGQVLKNRQFFVFASILWMGFSLMFAWIASSSLIIQNVLGFDTLTNALIFGGVSLLLVVASLITSKLSSRYKPIQFVKLGIAIQVVAVLILLVVVVTQFYVSWLVLPALLLIGSPMGFVFGPATALAMSELRHAAGTASALLGGFQFLTAGAATALISILGGNPLVGLSFIGIATMVIALVALRAARPSLRA